MELLKELQKIGLSEKEAGVYLALLELGRASVLKVAKKAGLKRPTVYLVLDSLIEKGLATLLPREKKKLYLAEKPRKFLTVLQDREKTLKELLPNLNAFYQKGEQKPDIRYYEGKEALGGIYEEIVKAPEIWFFATSIKLFSETYPEIFQKSLTVFDRKKKKVREIVSSEPFDIRYAKKYNNPPLRNIRVLPEDLVWYADSAIWEGKLAIFSLKKLFAIVIENEDIVESYKTIFELCWRSSKEV